VRSPRPPACRSTSCTATASCERGSSNLRSRQQQTPSPTAATPGSDRDDRVVVALTARLRDARGEVAELKAQLAAAHGELLALRRQLPQAAIQAADKET
jgi:hypothetical protein